MVERWRVSSSNRRLLSKAENIMHSMRRRYNTGPALESKERQKLLKKREEDIGKMVVILNKRIRIQTCSVNCLLIIKDDPKATPCPRQRLALIKLGTIRYGMLVHVGTWYVRGI